MADIFQDFVPEGEDAGALGGKGFQDFVPEREPELQELPTEEVKPAKKKKAAKLSKEDLEDLGVKTEEAEKEPAEAPVTSPTK